MSQCHLGVRKSPFRTDGQMAEGELSTSFGRTLVEKASFHTLLQKQLQALRSLDSQGSAPARQLAGLDRNATPSLQFGLTQLSNIGALRQNRRHRDDTHLGQLLQHSLETLPADGSHTQVNWATGFGLIGLATAQLHPDLLLPSLSARRQESSAIITPLTVANGEDLTDLQAQDPEEVMRGARVEGDLLPFLKRGVDEHTRGLQGRSNKRLTQSS